MSVSNENIEDIVLAKEWPEGEINVEVEPDLQRSVIEQQREDSMKTSLKNMNILSKESSRPFLVPKTSRGSIYYKGTGKTSPTRLSSSKQNISKLTSKAAARKLFDGIEDFEPTEPIRDPSTIKSASEDSEEDINLRVSITTLAEVKIKKPFSEKIYNFFGYFKLMTQEEFNDVVDKLYKCALKNIRDAHELHIRRSMALDMVEDINKRCPTSYITFPHVIHISWSIMSCMHHYQLRLKADALGIILLVRKKQYHRCIKAFIAFVRLLENGLRRVALNSIIIFYKEGKLWTVEFACADLIVIIMEVYNKPEECIQDTIQTIEDATCYNVYEAKQLIILLLDCLKVLKWRRMTRSLMERFLELYMSSIHSLPEHQYNYAPLRSGLELCLMNLIASLKRRDLRLMFELQTRKLAFLGSHQEELVTCLGHLSVYLAKKYRAKTKRPLSPKGILPDIIYLFQTEKRSLRRLGLKILLRLLDSDEMADRMLTPRIYYPHHFYYLPKPKCYRADKLFFKDFRRFYYHICLNGFINARDRMSMEEVHKAAMVTQIQVCCGYSTSCFIAVAMALQEYAIRIMKDELMKSHHLHAVVMSILTFTCTVLQATYLWEYVSTVMRRRAELAPHLNPPLQPRYEYALHHILWNKPDLFFEDWEVRFGLWKCFRVRRQCKTEDAKRNSNLVDTRTMTRRGAITDKHQVNKSGVTSATAV